MIQLQIAPGQIIVLEHVEAVTELAAKIPDNQYIPYGQPGGPEKVNGIDSNNREPLKLGEPFIQVDMISGKFHQVKISMKQWLEYVDKMAFQMNLAKRR